MVLENTIHVLYGLKVPSRFELLSQLTPFYSHFLSSIVWMCHAGWLMQLLLLYFERMTLIADREDLVLSLGYGCT